MHNVTAKKNTNKVTGDAPKAHMPRVVTRASNFGDKRLKRQGTRSARFHAAIEG